MCCSLVWLHLHLAWFSHTAYWIIFPQGPVLLPAAQSTQRRPSPKLMLMLPDKNLQFLQCPTAKVEFPSLLQVKMRFLLLTQMCLMVLNAFLVSIPYPNWSKCHTQTDPLLTILCSSERVFQTRDWQDVMSEIS